MDFPILRYFFSHRPSDPVFYLERVKPGNDPGVLPCVSHVGMCSSEGYSF